MKAISLIWIVTSVAVSAATTTTVSYTLNNLGLYPESIAYLRSQDTFLMGSLGHGNVTSFHPSTNKIDTYIALQNSLHEVMTTHGIIIDQFSNKVIVLQHAPDFFAAKRPYGVSVVRSEDKSQTFIDLTAVTNGTRGVVGVNGVQLNPTDNHIGNDATTDPKGNMYITDSFGNNIIKVDANGTPSILSQSAVFGTDQDGAGTFGVDGITWFAGKNTSPDYLVVNNFQSGHLFKVTIEASPKVTVVGGVRVPSADGLKPFSNGSIATIETTIGTYVVLGSSDEWSTATVIANNTICAPTEACAALVVLPDDSVFTATSFLFDLFQGVSNRSMFYVRGEGVGNSVSANGTLATLASTFATGASISPSGTGLASAVGIATSGCLVAVMQFWIICFLFA